MTHESEFDISVVITSHDEGALAHRTLRSAVAAIRRAEQADLKCEIIVVQDHATAETQEYFATQTLCDLHTIEVSHGDLGLSRNSGVEQASGKYVAFLDADDIYCDEWLVRAAKHADKLDGTEFALHPQFTVLFEDAWCINEHYSTSDKRFDWRDLVAQNLWTSLIFLPRDLISRLPFSVGRAGSGFGYEDWDWYSRAISEGVSIEVVKDTSCFVRRKAAGSLVSRHNTSGALLPPTPFLSPENIRDRERPSVANKPRWSHRVWDSMLRSTRDKRPRLHSLTRVAHDLFLKVDARRNRVRKLPDSLDCQWRQVHDVEPQLFPDTWSLWRYSWRELPTPDIGEAYRMLCQQATSDASHVYVVPAVQLGLVVLLNYTRGLTQHELARGIRVITTSSIESVWKDKLPSSVAVVEFGKICQKLTDDQKAFLLATFLVQSQPKVVHVLNSQEGFHALRKYGKSLEKVAKLYVSAFAESINEHGREYGFPLDELPHCFQHLSGVLSDNHRIFEKLQKLFALDSDRLFAHYQPVDLPDRSLQRTAGNRLRVLWASRLDREKRPDLLMEIADRCADLPLDFHVFGQSYLAKDRISHRLAAKPNITYHGKFDGFQSVEPHRYDIFLYTSQSDGVPNVVLEAMACGLPVVASDVGALDEAITHNETGILVSPYDDVEQFVSALKRFSDDHGEISRIGNLARERVATQHSWEQFIDSIRATPGYV